ncbi:unnamed protein product [Clonostachys rosea]|uniref:Glycosyl hydrolases family 39 N-terminal catalytic domain-containing protein n=1 Tax=Bionectria ochroleuca TaxID=29856 RepID=A0ABY6UWL1_BIOOC|nr:unnamed protein product [Clonostachys rosea]
MEPVDWLKKFWSVVAGAGRANEGLRADWQKHLSAVTDVLGFRFVRFHGLFHDDMFVYNEVDGEVVYNFQYIDALFDALLNLGVRPFVAFNFMPSQIATKRNTTFWWNGHGSPPTEMSRWEGLISATMGHWKERYGVAELERWYFEVWNEPNLYGFWAGSRSQYYEMYEKTARIVRQTGANLKVGGPSTSNFVPDTRFDGDMEDMEVQKPLAELKDIDSLSWRPVWIAHFLRWCKSSDVPVDFVSCHPYPTDWALDSRGGQSKRVRQLNATPDDLRLVHKMISESPFPDLEVHLTEWNSSPSSRDHNHDYVPAAIYLARTFLCSLNQVDSLTYWTFTDVFEEEGAGLEPFHGGFGLVNQQGIPKPTYHIFRMLEGLGDEVLDRHDDHGIITRHADSGLLSALLFHYPPEMKTSPPPAYKDRSVAHETVATGSPMPKSLVLDGVRPGASFILETLTPGQQGDVVTAWEKLGSPRHLTRELTKKLAAYASSLSTQHLTADASGKVEVAETLPAWTVIALKEVA